jgi:ATP-dependent DNA ligase
MPGVTEEIKFDGYRLQAVKQKELTTTLYSRSRNILNGTFPYIAEALKGIPHGTVVDGELVALGPDGRPSFNLLQNFRSTESHIMFYAFDILAHEDRDLTHVSCQNFVSLARSQNQQLSVVRLPGSGVT